MAIYMQYNGIDGAVTTQGFINWIELNSFQWAISRDIGTAARGALSRESSEPMIAEVTVTKYMCKSAPKLLQEAVAGPLNKTVIIKFTTTTRDKVDTFLTYQFDNVGISQYSMSSGGEMPIESLTLNFTKVMETFVGMDPSIAGSPETVGYDLTLMQKV